MSKLPNDLRLQVLARLPIKSLVKFKSVCKLWKELISSKHFVDLQYQISSHNPILLIEIVDWKTQAASSFVFFDQHRRFFEFSMEFPNDDRVRVRASCNGLLCCSSIKNRGVFYVCNPMTREIKILPRIREHRPFTNTQPSYEATLVGLAFNDQTSGFDVVTAGFHRRFGQPPQEQLICTVYDSVTNAWRRYNSPLDFDTFSHMNCNQVVFAGGSFHWLTQSYSYLLTFNLWDKSWRKIPLPDETVETISSARIYLLELEGSVSLIMISKEFLYTWVLKDPVRGEWVLFYEVELEFIGSIFPVMQNRDVVFFAAVNRLSVYCRNKEELESICDERETSAVPLWFSAYAFRKSLFSCH